MDLSERIQHVMTTRGLTARGWSDLALLTPTHVSGILRRLKEDPEATVEIETLAKLAAAAGVSFEWLATGAGNPTAVALNIPDDPKYPTRGRVIGAAALLGYPQAAIEAIMQVHNLPADPGTNYWLNLLMIRAEESVAVGANNKRR